MTSKVVKQIPLEEEYNKNPGITPDDINKLREWLSTQPHLPGEHFTDLDLILAYNCSDRSMEVSKQLLDLHYTMRTLLDPLFKDRVFDDRVERSLKSFFMMHMPKHTVEGYSVIFSCYLEDHTKNFNLVDVIRTVIMILDLWQYEEGTCPGFIFILDMSRLSFGHYAKMDFQTLQQYVFYLQEGMLANLKSAHFINAPPFVDKMMMLLKPITKKSMYESIFVHPVGTRTLDNFFPIEELPKEAGGNYKGFDECRDEIQVKLKANKEFFETEAKKRVVEALRPGKSKTISDLFGSIEGSFKKLEID